MTTISDGLTHMKMSRPQVLELERRAEPQTQAPLERKVLVDEAVILAGGKGVRLRPYTTIVPKPLVPVGDRYSILEIILRQLADLGFKKVTLAIGHLGHIISAYVGDGSQWGLEVCCVTDDAPIGTLGPVVRMVDALPEHFLVMNADLLTNLNYRDLLDRHLTSDTPLTVATCRREHHVDFGVLDVTDRRILNLREKPSLSYLVNMGIYALSRSAIEGYARGAAIGFDTLMLDLIEKGTPPNSYEFDGYWADIGRPEDYDRVNAEFAMVEQMLLPNA